MSVFLQLPQIFILSTSEILVSITGLEFAYAQAPESMKSTVMALFLLTTAVGDLLGGGLYAALGENISPAALFLLCAVAMVLNTYVFYRVALKFVPLSSSISSDDGGSSMASNDQTRRRYSSIDNEDNDSEHQKSSINMVVLEAMTKIMKRWLTAFIPPTRYTSQLRVTRRETLNSNQREMTKFGRKSKKKGKKLRRRTASAYFVCRFQEIVESYCGSTGSGLRARDRETKITKSPFLNGD